MGRLTGVEEDLRRERIGEVLMKSHWPSSMNASMYLLAASRAQSLTR